MKRKAVLLPVGIAAGICVLVLLAAIGYCIYLNRIPTVTEQGNLLALYDPYTEPTRAVSLEEASELVLEGDCPVMDGATALYPVYASFAKAVYPKEERDAAEPVSTERETEFLRCTTTKGAYLNIVSGDAELIFVAAPSEEQTQFAEENGVELVYTPIGKEAFVFFVNSENPVETLSVEEIRGIYAGEITTWDELGIGGLGKIRAFQRDAGSGSQSALERLMAGKPLMTPPQEDVIDMMAGIVHRAADYKNFKNAIGFSFRFYATEMVQEPAIRLLRVNGVAPTSETIGDGSYPLTSYFYAVTRKDADEKVLRLLDWICGEQGREIIRKAGYTPLTE